MTTLRTALRFVLLAGAVAVVGTSAPAVAQVSAQVSMQADRTTVGVGETFRLEVRADVTGADVQSVDLPDLSAFRVVSRRVSQPIQFRFGFGSQTQTIQATVVHDLTLAPLREGRIELTPARVNAGGRSFASQPLTIEVVAGAGAPPSGLGVDPNVGNVATPPAGPLDGAIYDDHAFVRTVTDAREAWVGQQVTVTVYLYVRGPLRSSPVLTREPTADGFWVHDLLPAMRTIEPSQQLVQGVPFNVYLLRRFAAFPLREGELAIGAPTVTIETGSIFDIFQARPSGSLRRDGVAASIRARPLPADGRPDGTIAVGRYELFATLDRGEAPTGDAVTLTATVRGVGNVRDAAIELPEIPGVRALAPEIRDEVTSPNDLVGGTRTVRWLLVPEQPGEHAIPALTLGTFDPATASYQRLTTPPLTLRATGAPIANPDSDEGAAEGDEGETVQPSFGPVRTHTELERHRAPVTSEPFYRLAALVPPLAFFVLLVVSLARRRANARRAFNAPRDAVRRAKKRLGTAFSHAGTGDAAAFYGEIRHVLHAVLEARLAEPVGGFTHAQLREHLRRRGMDEDLVTRVVDEIEGSEFARFSASGASADEMKKCTERVSALLERMDKFAPLAEAS